ncbi:hypothetical protein Tco_1371553 [Tanacetum coccineum]
MASRINVDLKLGLLHKHSAKDSITYVSKKQQQQEWDAWVKEIVIDEDEVISKDETPELITEIQGVDKRVPIIYDYVIMKATLNDALSNQFKNAEEYACIEAYEPYSIVDKPSTGLIYLNSKDEKRVMYLTEIVKFYDATLEKVLKEVKLKIFQSETWRKPPLIDIPAEEQPLPAAASPTADSPRYVPESDPEEEPEEDDEDPEEDPADYPADREDDDDEDEEEEEEHPAPADSVPPVHRMTARISIRDEPSISLPPREEVERLLALTTPPPSPLTPLSSPLPQIPSPPLPIPSPPPNSPTHIEIPESCLPLRKRVRFASPTPSHEVGESSAVGAARQDGPAVAREDPYSVARGDLYGFVDMVDVAPGHPMSRELDYGITDTWDDLSALILELQSAEHRRQRVISELLASDHKRQVQLTKTLRLLKGLQTQMVEFQRQHRPAKGPAQPDAPGEA